MTWKPQTKEKEFVKEMSGAGPKRTVPEWLTLGRGHADGPRRHPAGIGRGDLRIDTRLIVEYYSR